MQKTMTKMAVLAAALSLASACSRETAPPAVSAPPPPNAGTPGAVETAQAAATGEPQANSAAVPSPEPAPSRKNEVAQPTAGSDRYIDYAVVDAQSQAVGNVVTVWEDPSGEPAFIGIKQPQAPDLLIVPSDAAQVNNVRRTVRLNVPIQQLGTAPRVSEDANLDEGVQKNVVAFYQRLQPAPVENQDQDQAQVQNQATIRLKEEKAQIGKRTVNAGGVILRKVVRTDTNQQPVTLRREELVIQRVPGGQPAPDNAQFSERDIYIPLRREVPVVQKDVVVKETVRVGKDVEQEQRNVTTRLREENLRIDRQQATGAAGVPAGTSRGVGSSGVDENAPPPAPPDNVQGQAAQDK